MNNYLISKNGDSNNSAIYFTNMVKIVKIKSLYLGKCET